ncbi:response regulator transcription factor [Streptomyces prasinus]|uniref:response regulator transcription factor n=1 Tax=Streptomyces prasinus TaxID=67345 RepID=UPI0036B98946
MSPQKRPSARELLTDTSVEILATVFAGQVRSAVIERALKQMAEAEAEAVARGAAHRRQAVTTLSDRQLAILRLRADGYSGPQIAAKLTIAVSTVDYHERVICHRLEAVNITNAVDRAYQAGIFRRERHGDHAGYAAHLYRGEDPCDACKTGERAYRNNLRQQREAAA